VTDLLRHIEQNIQTRDLFKSGRKILVAVSGGLDSMTLLHTLNILSAKNRWKIVVAHFNHRLRGRASDADERLVRKTAVLMKLPLVAESADVKAFAAKLKLSVEMAARQLRHEFLARAARKHKIKIIATAHHADDQVELFFLRLLRGAGGEGLAGMKWRSPSPADESVSLVRPLLDFSKCELTEFARESRIHFREDATNSSSDFLRNRIRNELLPLLRKNYQPGLDRTVLRLMEIVGAEAEFAGEAARLWSCESAHSKKSQSRLTPAATIQMNAFGKLPVAIQRRVLQSRLSEAGCVPDFELIEALRQSADCFVSVSPKLCVCRNKPGEIKLRTDSQPEFDVGELPVDLSVPAGKTVFGMSKLTWNLRTGAVPAGRGYRRAGSRGRSPHQNQQELFDADKIGGKIILRHWHPGDRFQPIGLKSAAKLQDLFVNAKIPAARRRELVLATTEEGEIFWVEGLRIGERFKLTPQTKRKLVWKWSNLAV
jgi:tRNA(Ile)-lysidine synthase